MRAGIGNTAISAAGFTSSPLSLQEIKQFQAIDLASI